MTVSISFSNQISNQFVGMNDVLITANRSNQKCLNNGIAEKLFWREVTEIDHVSSICSPEYLYRNMDTCHGLSKKTR